MNTTDKPKCTAADGKTEVHNMPGVGLVASAAAFNALVRDAERYRFLRNHPLQGAEEEWPCIRAADNDTAHWALTGVTADAAIDAAMQEKQS